MMPGREGIGGLRKGGDGRPSIQQQRRHGSLAIALVTRNGLERLKMARCRELIDIDPSGGLEGALQSFRWAEKQQVRQVRWLIAGPRRRTERQRPDKRQDLLTFC